MEFLDLQKNLLTPVEEQGCMIDHVHVRLGSRLHIDRFYDINQLLSSSVTVRLLSKRIVELLGDNRIACVLSQYEISSCLAEKICDDLIARQGGDVDYDVLHQQNHALPSFEHIRLENKETHYNILILVPVGTTLSNVYKLQEACKRSLDKADITFYNFCVAAIGDCYEDPSCVAKEPYSLFIAEVRPIDDASLRIALKPGIKEGKADVIALLHAPCSWHDGEHTGRHHDDFEALIGINKATMTLTPWQQPKIEKPKVVAYYKRFSDKDNLARLETLSPNHPSNIKPDHPSKHYVIKHHIKRGGNHFQFYIDHEAFYRDHRSEIQAYLKQLASKRKPTSKKGILICPLDPCNALYLEDVRTCYFDNDENLEVVFLNFEKTKKDDFINRYQYLAKLKNDAEFFYIDCSICSAKTISRVQKFLFFLFDGFKYFDKVFLLFNRCSYETSDVWVRDPSRDWNAYVHIAVPNYNTNDGHCPSCDIQDRYVLLGKQAATNNLANSFSATYEKEACRSISEYYAWLKERAEKRSVREWLINSGLNIEEYDTYDLIALDDWIRFSCMNDGYLNLIYGKKINAARANRESEKEAIFAEIFNLLLSSVKKAKDFKLHVKSENDMLSSADEAKIRSYLRLDYLVSYLKVISRPNLGNNLAVRQAIYQILSCVFLLLARQSLRTDEAKAALNDKETFSEVLKKGIRNKKIIQHILNYFREYQLIYWMIHNGVSLPGYGPSHAERVHQARLYKTLSHRLAMMHSEGVMDAPMLVDYFDTMGETSDMNDGKMSKLINQYVTSVKLAATAAQDDSLSFAVMNACNHLIKLGKTNPLYSAIARNLYLENTAMVYDFFSDLSLWVESKGFPLTDDIYYGIGGLSMRKANITNIGDCLENESMRLLLDPKNHQSPFSSYMRFLHSLYEEKNNDWLAAALHYYRILTFLSGNEYEAARSTTQYYDGVPYIFEDLCHTLIDITGAGCVRFAMLEGDSDMVSLCHAEKHNKNWEESERRLHFYNMIIGAGADAYMNLREIPFTDGIRIIDSTVGNECLIAVELPLLEGTTITDEDNDRRFMLFLDFDDLHYGANNEKGYEKRLLRILRTLHKVLYLRRSLLVALSRECAPLLNAKPKSDYVRPISKNGVRALILSDLHLTDDPRYLSKNDFSTEKSPLFKLLTDRIDGYLSGISESREDDDGPSSEQIKGDTNEKERSEKERTNDNRRLERADITAWTNPKFEENDPTPIDLGYKEKEYIDLVFVVGDLIQAASSAKEAQNRYKLVGDFLFNLAKRLWGDPLPHDWRKRFVIVPGNHDYTAMNEMTVRLQSRSRSIESGAPVTETGGLMSKLTYYLEFVSRFLHIPMSELLANDCNSIRHYKYMDMRILLLNTVSEANPIQTNKVSINAQDLKYVLKRHWNTGQTFDSEIRIVIAHHSCDYALNYISDMYSDWPEYPSREVQNKYEAADMKFRDLFSKHIAILGQSLPIGSDSYTDALLTMREDLMSLDVSEKMKKTTIYKDAKRICDLEDPTGNNIEIDLSDRQMKHLFTLFQLAQVCEIDSYDLKRAYGLIKGEYIMISGHEHIQRENELENGRIHVKIINRLRKYLYEKTRNVEKTVHFAVLTTSGSQGSSTSHHRDGGKQVSLKFNVVNFDLTDNKPRKKKGASADDKTIPS